MVGDDIEELRIRWLQKCRDVGMTVMVTAMNIRSMAVVAGTIVVDEQNVGARGIGQIRL